jgi:hypothetical protein
VTEFREQDLSGTHFERVKIRNATFHRIHLNDAEMRDSRLQGIRMRGVEMVDVNISGDLQNVIVNGVDIAPLVEVELNRRMPQRAKMRPEDSDGFREAWAILEQLWEGTVTRARSLPEEKLHENVDGEWSFIQTLRHLSFATAGLVERMLLGQLTPWHPLDLPADEAPEWEGIRWDREARPSLEDVLEVRRRRQAAVRDVLASLTDEQLASEVTRTEPGWPRLENFPFRKCLLIVLKEEWEHRLYAVRDLSTLEQTA